jgi:hypothetical protein
VVFYHINVASLLKESHAAFGWRVACGVDSMSCNNFWRIFIINYEGEPYSQSREYVVCHAGEG